MFKTRVCDALGIKYPIIQAAMNWITSAELVAAVSNSGGVGTIGPNAEQTTGSEDVDEVGRRWRTVIRRTKALTKKPFAVNISVAPDGRKFSDKIVEVAIEEGVQVALTIAGHPNVYTKRLKDAGMKVLHAGSNVQHARVAEESGADAFVLECTEGGGRSGTARLTTFVAVPQVVDAVKLPVIVGGGIANARQVMAVMALGAEGIYMGTRFMATNECPLHPKVKELILKAGDSSTASFGAKVTSTSRAFKNPFVEKYLQMELTGATAEELNAFERAPISNGMGRTFAGLIEGDLEEGTLYMGAGSSLIKEVVPAGNVIPAIAAEAEKLLAAARV